MILMRVTLLVMILIMMMRRRMVKILMTIREAPLSEKCSFF